MSSLAEKIQTFQSRRRFPDWKPQAPTTKAKGTCDVVIHRCLMFLNLELQVSDWVTSLGLEPEVQQHFDRNSLDENKHIKVLTMLADYYRDTLDGETRKKEEEKAKVLEERWRSLTTHPIVSTYCLEMGVFFTILPLLIKKGDAYAAAVSQWISDDERVHVECALAVIKEKGLKITKENAQLVYDTVYFITGSSAEAERAVKRLLSGKDESMKNESLPVTIAYFEQHDKRSIVY